VIDFGEPVVEVEVASDVSVIVDVPSEPVVEVDVDPEPGDE
jgi:hypothetical protein